MQEEIKLLEFCFGRDHQNWKGNQDKHKKLFCRKYEELMEGCKEVRKIENNLVCIAFKKCYRESVDELRIIRDRIIEMEG